MMQKLGMEKGEAIEHPWVTKAIENAQRKVEGHNFDIRKNLLEYDNVANDQRKVIYAQRNELMAADDISAKIAAMREDMVDTLISTYIPPQSMDELWDVPGWNKPWNRKSVCRCRCGNGWTKTTNCMKSPCVNASTKR